jgi:hypothetical protein
LGLFTNNLGGVCASLILMCPPVLVSPCDDRSTPPLLHSLRALPLSLRLQLQEGTRKRQEGTRRLGNELCPHPCGWWISHPPGHSHHL